ncbi:MFS transporter [Amycolatopsis kentuckyensis]|uniref:MFS transporter n=1 Tax=Amycolatopsis kentuckyensis TaxID=218823 RepID=UPI000A3B9A21|nr:MFS transporter [Amycolatopsis kentuckyensis]
MDNSRSGPTRHPWSTLTAVCLAGMLVGLDGTALTVAGPEMGRSAGASFGELQWIANAYLVALALALVPAGRLADRAGRRKVFLAGVGGFGLASALVATGTTSELLIAFRGLQGLCAALLQPAALALVRSAFGRARLELALGIWGATSAAAIAAGPIIAGAVVHAFGWPAVFLMNVPVALVVVAVTGYRVTESRAPGPPGRPAELLRTPGVAIGAALTAMAFFALFGLLFCLTLYLQNLRGLDPVHTGEWLLPVTCSVVLGAPLGGALVARFGPRGPAAGGFALLAAGITGLLVLGTDTAWAATGPATVVTGLGTGVALIAATQVIVAGAPESMSAQASALQQVATQLGGAVGIAVLSAVVSWRVAAELPRGGPVDETAQGRGPAFVPGLHAAVLVAAAVIALGALLALRIRPDSAGMAADPAGPPATPSQVDGEGGHQ